GALGNTVNLGSRVQGVNKQLRTRVLLTGSTHAKLGAGFLTRRLCSVRVLGLEDPVVLFELIPEGRDDWPQCKTDYEQALEHFENGEFNGASRLLSNLVAVHRHDGPALLLLHRTVKCRVEGVPASHPVWEVTEK